MISDISFTHVSREFWSYTELTYYCEPDHEFRFGETDTRVCESYGIWNDNVAPECVPSMLTYKL